MLRETKASGPRVTIVSTSLILLAIAVKAHAQVKTPRIPRNPKAPVSQGTAGRTQLPVASGSLTLPAWLDDTETLDPGTTTFDLSVGRWSSVDGGETDGPVLDFAVGLTPRLQVGGTLPYYRASYNDGFSAHGLGDAYFSVKAQLLDPGDNVIGLSVQPLLEVLSESSVSDTTLGLSRVNWGIPVTVQVGSAETRTRAYATAGYFSRDAVFVGGTVEHEVSSVVTVLGMVNYSYATETSATSDLLGLSRSRTDASAMVYVSVAPTVTVYGGLGRTISKLDQNGARLIASVGIHIEVGHSRLQP